MCCATSGVQKCHSAINSKVYSCFRKYSDPLHSFCFKIHFLSVINTLSIDLFSATYLVQVIDRATKDAVRRVFHLCLCLKCFYRIKCDHHSAYKLTHLSISPSPAFFTCYHHLPHQPLQVYCTILCFNHSLNLLLGFYLLSRLAFYS